MPGASRPDTPSSPVRLDGTMETMHAAGRRRLPPVPQLSSEQAATLLLPARGSRSGTTRQAMLDVATERFVLGPPTGERPAAGTAFRRESLRAERMSAAAPADDDTARLEPVDTTTDEDVDVDVDLDPDGAAAPTTAPEQDAAQRFVAVLRAAAAEFAEAAGAASAVVREAVPPARHRRARCRVVLRFPDRTEIDVTFLGPAGAPSGAPSRHGFDRQIRRWLGTGQHRADAWLVPDPEAPGGLAVDVTAWLASS